MKFWKIRHWKKFKRNLTHWHNIQSNGNNVILLPFDKLRQKSYRRYEMSISNKEITPYVVQDCLVMKSLDSSAENLKDKIDNVVTLANSKGMVNAGSFYFSACELNDGEIVARYYYYRSETDKEQRKRLNEEMKIKNAGTLIAKTKKDKEYAHYLRLHKKFGTDE